MMLYHGTNIDIQSIDLALCRPYKDSQILDVWTAILIISMIL